MKPPLEILQLKSLAMGFEVFFTIIVVLCSFLIYFKTKEIYSLSEHRGIKYFRNGFFFIGFGNVVTFLHLISILYTFMIPMVFILTLSAMFTIIGITFLFSSMYAKIIKEYQIYGVALVLLIIGILFHTPIIMVLYSTILLLALGIVSFLKYKKSKKKRFSQMYIIYMLIVLTWIIGIFARILTDIPFGGKIINAIVSGIVFLYILYLVIEKLK